MRQSKFTETRIVSILKEADAGAVRRGGSSPLGSISLRPVMNQLMSSTFNSDRERPKVAYTSRSVSQC